MTKLPRADKPEEITAWTLQQLDNLDEADEAGMAWRGLSHA
jgi:hypothetical protein